MILLWVFAFICFYLATGARITKAWINLGYREEQEWIAAGSPFDGRSGTVFWYDDTWVTVCWILFWPLFVVGFCVVRPTSWLLKNYMVPEPVRQERKAERDAKKARAQAKREFVSNDCPKGKSLWPTN